MTAKDFASFLNYVTNPSAFCNFCEDLFNKKGFVCLKESNLPKDLPKSGYFIRSRKSILAYKIGGFESSVITAAHSDSPAIKLKPNIEKDTTLYHFLNLSNYTGGLAHTMFGRDLKICGNLFYKDSNGKLTYKYVDSGRPIGFIPFPEVTQSPELALTPSFNRDTNMNIITGTEGSRPVYDFLSEISGVPKDDIISSDLYLVDANPTGIDGDMLTSARIDNLASSYACLKGFLKAEPVNTINILVVFDNEECGSHTYNGALGDFLERALRFIASRANIDLQELKRKSIIISADAAHGQHPNYFNYHEKNHPPTLGKGLICKGIGQNTTSLNISAFLSIADSAKFANKKFNVVAKKNKSGGGGTIGPKMEMLNGISTVDVGIPVLGMHSYRETIAHSDLYRHIKIIQNLYEKYETIRKHIDGIPDDNGNENEDAQNDNDNENENDAEAEVEADADA